MSKVKTNKVLKFGATAFTAIGNIAMGNDTRMFTDTDTPIPTPFTFMPHFPYEKPMPRLKKSKN